MTKYDAFQLALGRANEAWRTHFSSMAIRRIRPIEGGWAWTVEEDGRICGGFVFEKDPHPNEKP